MWRVRVHQLRRVAHAARCAARDRSGTRGAAAPVSNPVRGGGGVARVLLLQPGLLSAARVGVLAYPWGQDFSNLNQFLPASPPSP